MSAEHLRGHPRLVIGIASSASERKRVGRSRSSARSQVTSCSLHARFSARERGCRSEKEPEGRCRGERCGQDQQQIGEPGRLGGCAGGSGAIEVVDLVRVDHLRRSCRCICHRICRRICHRICLGGFRGVCAGRPWQAGACALGRWESGPSRRRSRHRTFAPACVIERLIRTRRRHHRGSGFRPFLRNGLGRLLLRVRLARLRAGSGAWRLPFGLCLRLRCWARGMARFLLRLRRRRGRSRRIGGLLWHPYGAGIPIVVARLRTSQWQTREHPSPNCHDCQSA
jgi:hypothetical protein